MTIMYFIWCADIEEYDDFQSFDIQPTDTEYYEQFDLMVFKN